MAIISRCGFNPKGDLDVGNPLGRTAIHVTAGDVQRPLDTMTIIYLVSNVGALTVDSHIPKNRNFVAILNRVPNQL
jgi:hypothetical protein